MKFAVGSVLDRDHLAPEQAAAVFSLPQGTVIDSNRRFRDLFGTPETISDLDAPDLHRILRTWEGTEPRMIRRMTLGGIEGRGRLLPACADAAPTPGRYARSRGRCRQRAPVTF